MHALITRPEPDASQMQRQLAAEGITSDVAPLLTITTTAPDTVDLDGISALVVTSRNGLRSLEGLPQAALAPLLGLPLLVVGRGTGAAATALGFRDLTVGPASAKELLPLIIAKWREHIAPADPHAGPVLHIAGDKISFDLGPPLAAAGVPFRRVTVYRSEPATALPVEVVRGLREGAYDAVMLMSPLSARTYVHLVRSLGVAATPRPEAYLCLSKGIADELATLGRVRTRVAARPNIEEMVVLVRQLAAELAALSPPGEKRGKPV